MNDTIACVVAYNRADTLPSVLTALTAQMDASDVLVIDNASTDGTAAVVAAFAGVRYFNTGANLGGAGGFAWALEMAMALGYRYAYMLDDDAVPAVGAVEVLRSAAPSLVERGGFSFLVSVPVTAASDREPVGLPVPAKSWLHHRTAGKAGGIAVDYAAFLGVLIPLEVARRNALPYPEFFIWCDDVEYTRRISAGSGAACLPASEIEHESPEMESANHRRSLGWKYFYLVRNRLWLARWGLPRSDRGHRVASVLMALMATRDELVVGRFKPAVLRAAARAWREGLLRPQPAAHPVGSLLSASIEARAWLADQYTLGARAAGQLVGSAKAPRAGMMEDQRMASASTEH